MYEHPREFAPLNLTNIERCSLVHSIAVLAVSDIDLHRLERVLPR